MYHVCSIKICYCEYNFNGYNFLPNSQNEFSHKTKRRQPTKPNTENIEGSAVNPVLREGNFLIVEQSAAKIHAVKPQIRTYGVIR
jgi:monomeric isocitrate dehydrogenase